MFGKPKSVLYREKMEQIYKDEHEDDIDLCLYSVSRRFDLSKEKVVEMILSYHGHEIENYIPEIKKEFKLLTSALLRANNKKRLHYLAIFLNYIGETQYKPLIFPLEYLVESEQQPTIVKNKDHLINIFRQGDVTAEILFETYDKYVVPKNIFSEYMNTLLSDIILILEKFTSEFQKNVLDAIKLLKRSIKNPQYYPFLEEWTNVRTKR